jgi:hypothetical protein
MTTTKDLICFNCKHFDIIEGGCSAFPDGIPDIILLTNKHSKPLPDQGNDIVFTEKTGEDELFIIS